jgi:RNA polymerase primary sigma factor
MGEDRIVNRAVRLASEAAERTGEVTFDQLNALLPSDQTAPEIVEQVFFRLSEKGIRVVDDPDRSNPVSRLMSELRRFTGGDVEG